MTSIIMSSVSELTLSENERDCTGMCVCEIKNYFIVKSKNPSEFIGYLFLSETVSHSVVSDSL